MTAERGAQAQSLRAGLAHQIVGACRYAALCRKEVSGLGHLGYHESPIPGLLKGFGHIGLGGTLGWADPETGSAFAFVHNRLLTPMVIDMASFAGLARPMHNAIAAARHSGPKVVPQYGARYREPAAARKRVAGRR